MMSVSPRESESPRPPGHDGIKPGGAYARYALAVLVLVYVLNLVDRQIISILAERIKADLGITDAQLGFLYGTAFAIFFAVFGIPLARLADNWKRTRLISLGLGFWSLVTVLSGLAGNFAQLAAARFGVGLGEASAAPAAHSLLSDYFPRKWRATALAVFASGAFIGTGLGLGIGGLVVDAWDRAYAAGPSPFGLRAWQVAFFVVGLPGLLLAIWVASLREPRRGQVDGIYAASDRHPFRAFFAEMAQMLPPMDLVRLVRTGAGPRQLIKNVIAAIGLAVLAWAAIRLTGDVAQWTALCTGIYIAYSWVQSLRRRDGPAYALIIQTPALRYMALGSGSVSFINYGIGFWAAPYLIRTHGVTVAEVGLMLGGLSAAGGWLGVTLGGILSDLWRRRSVAGRVYFCLAAAGAALVNGLTLFTVTDTGLFYFLFFPFMVFSTAWLGPGTSTVQDLVLPRMRATGAAMYFLTTTFIGAGLGPYTVGRLSLALGDLGAAILISLGILALAAVFFTLAARHMGDAETSMGGRVKRAGETN